MPAPIFTRNPVDGAVSNESDIAELNRVVGEIYDTANPEDRERAETAADRADLAAELADSEGNAALALQYRNETAEIRDSILGAPWLDSFAALIGDTGLTYTADQDGTVVAGDLVQTRIDRLVCAVAAPDATDHSYATAEGVKLYEQRRQGQASPAAAFWRRLRAEDMDVRVFIGSDSTGNEAWEWTRMWPDFVAGVALTHTIKIKYLNAGTSSWDAYTTIQTGTGDRTVFFDVAAVAGSNSYYLEGERETEIFGGNPYSLAILNYGHNLGTDGRESTVFDECLIAALNTHLRCPSAQIVVTAQNPRTSENGLGQSKGLAAAWRRVADLTGCALIDVQSRFLRRADWATALMQDETHPNATGQAIWVAAVKDVLFEPDLLDAEASRATGLPLLSTVGQNIAPNPMFTRWTGAAPDGWTLTNCTAIKQPGRAESGLYSVEITGGVATGTVSWTVPAGLLPSLRGRTVVALAKIWKPSGGSSTAGRIFVTTSNGTSVSKQSRARGDVGVDGWSWAIVQNTVQTDATTVELAMYSGDATDNGKRIWLQSLALFVSDVPAGLDLSPVADSVITEYFSEFLVGPKGVSEDAVLVVGPDSITATGATPGSNADTVIDFPALEAGATYRVTCDVASGDPAYTIGVLARSGAGGSGSTLATAAWASGSTGATLDFTPTSAVASLWLYVTGSSTGFGITSITVEKL